MGEDGGLIARTGADFEDFGSGFELELKGHDGDDPGLGDELAVGDGER